MRKFSSKIIIFVLLVISSIGLFAQQNLQYNDLKQTLQPDPKVKIGILPNGLKYYIKENRKPEKRMEVLLAVKAGAVLEDDDQNGLAHFNEHMAFNGTKHFPKNDLVDFLEKIGIKFGADLNAFTNYDETVYMLQLPTDKEELLEKGMLVLDDWSHNVSFDDTEIDKERGVILEEWRLGKGAEDRVDKKHDKKVFYNSRYVERDVIGDTAIINHFEHSVIRRFYKDWYRPDLMAVIAVGDFNKDDIEKRIIAHFSDLTNPQNERTRTEYTIPPHKETLVSIATDKELSFPSVRIYFKHPGRESTSLGSYRQDIIDNIFSTLINNRFAELRRKSNPPFLFAMANEGRFVDHIRAFMLFGGAKGDGINQCTEALLTEAFRVMKHGFTQTELDRAKKDALRNIEKAYDEREKTESRNFAFEFERNFIDGEPMPGLETELEINKQFMPGITLDEVNQLSNKLITKENTVITVSAPDRKGVIPPTEAEVLSMYDNISKKDIPAYEDVVITKPLLSKKPEPGKIVEEKQIKEIGVTEWKLSNGVRVLLKPTDFKNDQILFTSFSPGGTSQVKDEDFVSASAAASIINQSGV
ncbi:MAG: pitrilysin family protein, partial [FCB group bacterium]